MIDVSQKVPSNVAAEQALLGAILANEKAYHAVSSFLRPEHFYNPLHRRIYAEADARIRSGRLADPVSMHAWMTADPDQSDGNASYLGQLLAATVGILSAKEYGRAILDTWRRRRLIEIGEELMVSARGQEEMSDDVLTKSVAMIESAFDARAERQPTSLDEAMDEAIACAEDVAKRRGPSGISTGFASLDDRIDGLDPDTLHVLAGRPGMGKSALAHQIAVNAARAGHGVLEVSLEMSAKELGRRTLSAVSGISIQSLKRGYFGPSGADRLVKARQELAGLPLTIEDGSGLTVQQIDLRARAAKRKHGLDLIMVDHLHIVRPEDGDVRQGATWAVGRISGAMKRMAKRHRCAVLLAAQLNRMVEARDDKRPTLADLRQAGDIEQDADTVSFLYRPEYYMQNSPQRTSTQSAELFERKLAEWHDQKERVRGKAELIVAKVRDGAPGTARLLFHPETTRFEDDLDAATRGEF